MEIKFLENNINTFTSYIREIYEKDKIDKFNIAILNYLNSSDDFQLESFIEKNNNYKKDYDNFINESTSERIFRKINSYLEDSSNFKLSNNSYGNNELLLPIDKEKLMINIRFNKYNLISSLSINPNIETNINESDKTTLSYLKIEKKLNKILSDKINNKNNEILLKLEEKLNNEYKSDSIQIEMSCVRDKYIKTKIFSTINNDKQELEEAPIINFNPLYIIDDNLKELIEENIKSQIEFNKIDRQQELRRQKQLQLNPENIDLMNADELRIHFGISNPIKPEQRQLLIDKAIKQNCGLNASIKLHKNSEDITIQFEDGTIKHDTLFSFLHRTVIHPELDYKNNNRNFYGFRVIKPPVLNKKDNQYYYECVNIYTKAYMVLTPKEMIQYEKENNYQKDFEVENNITPKKGRPKKVVIRDHEGNEFKSIKQMCDHYDIPVNYYNRKRKAGFPIKDCLTLEKVYDHEGNEFKNIRQMCDYWNVQHNTYLCRIKRGLSLEESLLGCKIIDHKGNEFRNTKDLCQYWNIDIRTFHERFHRNWDIERILTTPKGINQGEKIECIDHEGNKFSSVNKLCEYWNISRPLLQGRIKEYNYDLSIIPKDILKKILTTPPRHQVHDFKDTTIKYKQNCGLELNIINYKNKTNVDIQFEDGTVLNDVQPQAIINGGINHPNLKKNMEFYGFIINKTCKNEKSENGERLYMTTKKADCKPYLLTAKDMMEIYKKEHNIKKDVTLKDIYEAYKLIESIEKEKTDIER